MYALAFWLAITFTVAGAAMGLIGVWWKTFWKDEIGWRLILTDIILAGTSVAVALMTKWLG